MGGWGQDAPLGGQERQEVPGGIFLLCLVCDLVFCRVKAGSKVQPARQGFVKAGRARYPAWSLPSWARLVKAGRAGGRHLSGHPAWSSPWWARLVPW